MTFAGVLKKALKPIDPRNLASPYFRYPDEYVTEAVNKLLQSSWTLNQIDGKAVYKAVVPLGVANQDLYEQALKRLGVQSFEFKRHEQNYGGIPSSRLFVEIAANEYDEHIAPLKMSKQAGI